MPILWEKGRFNNDLDVAQARGVPLSPLPWRIDGFFRYESFIFCCCRRDYRSFDFFDYPGYYAKSNAVDHFLDFNPFHPFLDVKPIFCSFKAAGRP